LDINSSKEVLAKGSVKHNATVHSKIYQALLQLEKRGVKWTPEEEAMLLQMKNDGCPWEEISTVLSCGSMGTIRVRYSTKFKR